MLKQKEWIDVIVTKTGCTKKDAKLIFDCVFDYIREQISEEEPIKIQGFGVFKLRKTAAKEQINLITGQPEIVPEHGVVTFKPQFEIDPKPEAIEVEDEEVIEEVVETVVEPIHAEEEVVEEVQEEVQEEVVEEAQEEDNTNEELEALKQALEEERRKFEEEKAALISEKEELEKRLAEGEATETAPQGNVEEYQARLEMLKERLAANEKELRKVKKEFLPLRRVAKTLEADEKKLRRKEAIVAKQKVILYGVNNIGDIDEEKAKKLEEDLDILEGFRLSVQHCQEVMDANKERYPILERTYNILAENNETLKKDIEETENAIAALEANVEEAVEVQEEAAVETTENVDTDNE